MVTPINPAAQAGTVQSPRVSFLDGLSPRLNTLSAMVDAATMERNSNSTEPLIRRLRAMRAAADAVGLEEIGLEFDTCAAALANKPWSSAVRSELLEHLNTIGRLGQAATRDAAARPSGAAPRLTAEQKGATPVGPFTVVALASESQKVILRQALEQADEFNLHCTQDAGEAAALLSTYDPDLFVVDGRRADVEQMLTLCEGCGVMVVDARGNDVERFRECGARWVTTIGEHYETELLEGLRHRRRSQSMIAPRGESVVTLASFADEVAGEVKQALLNTANGQGGDMVLPMGEGTSVQTAVWSMLARLRDTVTELSHGAIKYDPHTPSGAMIVTGKDAMRRSGRTRASAENLAGRKVLVAEDDTSVGWYLTSLLRGKGAIVTEATDGLEALRQARHEAPDLVICDVMLPALDGFALCRNLKHDVALSDVPVILLSWKEDLLQRVRELGAGADGYLAKEAEASVIVDRCAEALEPRARIEKRLLVERVVHGRLDGVTPRLVLQLASRAVDNAKVVLQDAAFQYEVCLGDGRILTARRKAADGTVESGEKVLPGLLGMRAGRFTVERIREHVQAELYGSVDKVLAPFIERARRATRRLKGADLYDVSRVVIDTTALQPYLSVSPPIVNKIVERLRDGASPGELLHSVSAGLLESVLEDLALRGGILQVIASDGDDLLEEEQRDSVAAFDMELRSARSQQMKAATGAPVIGPRSTPDEAVAAAEFAGEVNAPVSPSSRPSYAPVVVAAPGRSAEEARAELQQDRGSKVPPADARSTVLGLAPEAPRPERISVLPVLPQATLTLEDDAPRGENAIPTLRPPSADSTPPSGIKWSIAQAAEQATLGVDDDEVESTPGDGLARALGGWTPVEARVSRREDVGRVILESGSSEDGGIDLAEAVAGLSGTPTPAQVQVVRRPTVRVLSGGSASQSDTTVGAVSTQNDTLTGLGALPPPEHVDAGARPEVDGPPNLQDSWRAPRLDKPEEDGSSEVVIPASTLVLPKVIVAEDVTPPSAPSVAPPPEEVSTPAVSASPVAEGLGIEIPVRPLSPPSIPPAAEAPPQLSWMARAEPTRDVEEASSAPTKVLGQTDSGEWLRRVGRGLRPVGVVTAAALGAFLGMNQLAKWLAPEADRQPQAPAVTAVAPVASFAAGPDEVDDLAIAPPGEQKVARKAVASTHDLPLPEGLTLAVGKGLLEVDSGGQHKLYVDNVFVGRGPIRRIPIDPGTHQVQTQLDGVEELHSVVVTAGRRARLELTESGQ